MPDDLRAAGVRRARQERLVAAAVEHRPRVVAHAAVDRDVGADAGQLLDGADGVEGDRRRRDDRPPRLGGDAGADSRVLLGGRVHARRAHSVMRRRLLALDVGDAEPAADRQLGQPAVLHERRQHLDGLRGRSRPRTPGCRCGRGARRGRPSGDARRALDRRGGVAGGQAEPELRVVLAGRHVLVGVGLDARA